MKFTDNGGDFEKPAPGPYAARLFKVVDLGTQEGSYMGQVTHQRKVLLGWELSKTTQDGKPFAIFQRYTVSLSEKSTLRKLFDSWLGKKMGPEMIEKFDIKKWLGAACLLTLVSSENGNYINVASASRLPEEMKAAPLVNSKVYFDLDDFDQEIFDTFTDKLKATIMGSPEWESRSIPPEGPGGQSNGDDDIPF